MVTDERLMQVSHLAHIVYLPMRVLADKAGQLKETLVIIRNHTGLYATPEQIEAALGELALSGLITRYGDGAIKYIEYGEDMHGAKWEAESAIPRPDEVCLGEISERFPTYSYLYHHPSIQ